MPGGDDTGDGVRGARRAHVPPGLEENLRDGTGVGDDAFEHLLRSDLEQEVEGCGEAGPQHVGHRPRLPPRGPGRGWGPPPSPWIASSTTGILRACASRASPATGATQPVWNAT